MLWSKGSLTASLTYTPQASYSTALAVLSVSKLSYVLNWLVLYLVIAWSYTWLYNSNNNLSLFLWIAIVNDMSLQTNQFGSSVAWTYQVSDKLLIFDFLIANESVDACAANQSTVTDLFNFAEVWKSKNEAESEEGIDRYCGKLKKFFQKGGCGLKLLKLHIDLINNCVVPAASDDKLLWQLWLVIKPVWVMRHNILQQIIVQAGDSEELLNTWEGNCCCPVCFCPALCLSYDYWVFNQMLCFFFVSPEIWTVENKCLFS